MKFLKKALVIWTLLKLITTGLLNKGPKIDHWGTPVRIFSKEDLVNATQHVKTIDSYGIKMFWKEIKSYSHVKMKSEFPIKNRVSLIWISVYLYSHMWTYREGSI